MQQLKQFFKENTWLAWSILLTVLACAMSITLRLFTEVDLPFQTFAAILGVIITAIITQILLIGQTKSDVTREKDAKIFEEKLKIYQDFLSTLCEVISDHKVTDQEKIQLQFQTSYISMHTTSEHVEQISKSVKQLLDISCSGKYDEEGNEKDTSLVLDPLFSIIQCFREELYSGNNLNKDSKFIPEKLKETIDNFQEAYKKAADNSGDEVETTPDSSQKMTVDLNIVSGSLIAPFASAAQQGQSAVPVEVAEQKKVNLSAWNEATARWKDNGWRTVLDEQTGFFKITAFGERLKSCPDEINNGYWENKPYIQNSYNDKSGIELAKVLKWEYSGRRSYGQWWTTLEEPFASIKEEDHATEFKTNTELQKKYIAWVDEIIKWTESYFNSRKIWIALDKRLKLQSDWKIWIYYANTIACDSNIEEEDKPFFDVYEDAERGKIVFVFYNRANNEETALKTLQRIGAEGCKDNRIQENRILLDTMERTSTPLQIAKRIEEWSAKIRTY